MAKVHDVLDMWQGSHNLCATQKESCIQNKQMTAVEYISDTEEIKASRSNFQHDGAAASTLSERSPLPPAFSAKDMPGGRTQILNVHWIKQIDHHPAESAENSARESISNTNAWHNWNGVFDNRNTSEDHCEADKNFILSYTMASMHWKAQSTRMREPHQMFPNWFGKHGGQSDGPNSGWRQSLQWKQGGIRETRKCCTEWVNMFSPCSICCLMENFT